MVDLSTENKALCFEDSTKKPLKLFIYYPVEVESGISTHEWHYFTTIENAIILESAEIEEGILDSNKFELGSFVIPQFKVKWNNDGIKYKNLACIPVQQIGDEYIAYFDGYIKTEEISDNIVTATIVPFIDKVLDVDVSIQLTAEGYGGTTIAERIWAALMYGDTYTNPNISVDLDTLKSSFINANKTFNNLTTEEIGGKLSVSDFLKMCGEFLGANVKILGKRKVDIEDMTTYQFGGSFDIPTTNIEFVRIPNIKSYASTFIDSETSQLPNEYERVEYIQTNGSQYIKTKYIPNYKTKIKMRFYNVSKYDTDGTIRTSCFFGARTNQTVKSFALFASVTGEQPLNNFWYDVGGNRAKIYISPLYEQNIIATNTTLISNAVKIAYMLHENFECEYPLYLFSVNTAGVADPRCALGKLYEFSIYEYGELILNMIPCIRKSDNKSGLYDLVSGEFYTDANGRNFITPVSIGTYKLPYYINLNYDKLKFPNIDGIELTTKTGKPLQLHYTQWWETNPLNFYEIKDNLFFESLNDENRQDALYDVGSYLSNLNFYYAELQSIYAPFFEAGDMIICKSKNSKLISDDYVLLDYIKIDGNTNFIFTGIYPNTNNIDLSIKFEANSNSTSIFESDGSGNYYDTLSLIIENGVLKGYANYIGGSIKVPLFIVENNFPLNQTIDYNFKYQKGVGYEYNGIFFGGSGNEYLGRPINTNTQLVLGSWGTAKLKLYHFAYKDDNTEVDMYPCIRKSDKKIGMLNILNNEFFGTNGDAGYDYQYADISVPILSSSASGIHSMIADIRCKATETK